jgi:NADP-dependent 3-hydroxy acid dehydrogenase YdfG
VETTGAIISAMQSAAPPGQADIDDPTLAALRRLTDMLLASKPEADDEYARFLQIRQRSVPVHGPTLRSWIQDRNVLVVGGTGCIGSSLIQQIRPYIPKQIVSISRGKTMAHSKAPGAIYRHLDIRDRDGIKHLIAEIRPDIVFHLAGQRDPGLAERAVRHTVTTNIFGTRNVLAAAAAAGAQFVVHASTGKAMRPYSCEVYAATKRIAEFVASEVRDPSRNYSAVRFTHIVDNSIVHDRLQEPGHSRFFRLHGSDVVFYAQSAQESAQLMLIAGLTSASDGIQVHAIRDLGWPVSLLDLAIGALRHASSGIPIYFSGFDSGYEDTVRPDLFDPATGGHVSPLFNKFEAARAKPSSGATDMFTLRRGWTSHISEAIESLEHTCHRTAQAAPIKEALNVVSLALRDAAPPGPTSLGA